MTYALSKPIRIRLSEPLWPLGIDRLYGASGTDCRSLEQSLELPLQRESEGLEHTRKQSASTSSPSEPINHNWDDFVERTRANFDESRSYGGFLKTYRPVELGHVSPQEQQARRAQLTQLARQSRTADRHGT